MSSRGRCIVTVINFPEMFSYSNVVFNIQMLLEIQMIKIHRKCAKVINYIFFLEHILISNKVYKISFIVPIPPEQRSYSTMANIIFNIHMLIEIRMIKI